MARVQLGHRGAKAKQVVHRVPGRERRERIVAPVRRDRAPPGRRPRRDSRARRAPRRRRRVRGSPTARRARATRASSGPAPLRRRVAARGANVSARSHLPTDLAVARGCARSRGGAPTVSRPSRSPHAGRAPPQADDERGRHRHEPERRGRASRPSLRARAASRCLTDLDRPARTTRAGLDSRRRERAAARAPAKTSRAPPRRHSPRSGRTVRRGWGSPPAWACSPPSRRGGASPSTRSPSCSARTGARRAFGSRAARTRGPCARRDRPGR